MTDQNVVPIRASEKQQEAVARTANGERVTLNDCERLLAAQQGFESDLLVSDTAFNVTMPEYKENKYPFAPRPAVVHGQYATRQTLETMETGLNSAPGVQHRATSY